MSLTGNQKCSCCFQKCFVIYSFFWKYFPHISPVISLNVFSTWKITKIQLARWYLWKEIQEELNPEETFTKQPQFFFINPRQRFSHLKQLLQNPGLKEMSGFPSSSIYSVENLRSTALLISNTGLKTFRRYGLLRGHFLANFFLLFLLW